MNFLSDVVPPINPANQTMNYVSLSLICIAAILFVLAIVLRALRLREFSRVTILFGCLFLLGYSSLFFIDIPSYSVWTTQDFCSLMLFVSVALLTIISFIMVVRKR